MRIIVFSERLKPPPDEGIKNFTLRLADALLELGHEVALLTACGRDWPERGVVNVRAGRLLRSTALKERIRTFRPDATVYVPTASLTWASGIRSQRLKRYGKGKPVALAALQGRRHNALTRQLARLAAPDLCLTMSWATERQARELGWRTERIAPIVDSCLFVPVAVQEKAALRERYSIPADAFVVLHVGHLTASRGIEDLASITDISYPLFVFSRSDVRTEAWVKSLSDSGVHVVPGYVEEIQVFYQLADAYLFPVIPSQIAPGSIDFPLSVLEALSCNIPVVATRFGALPETWPDRPGVSFYETLEGLRSALARLRHWQGETKGLVKDFSGKKTAQKIMDVLLLQEAARNREQD